MLSLVNVVYLFKLISIRRKDKGKKDKEIIYGRYFVIGIILFSIWGRCVGLVSENEYDLQQEIDILTEINCQLEERKETIQYDISNNIELQNKVELLNKEIQNNKQEIKINIRKKEIIPIARWLVYFG